MMMYRSSKWLILMSVVMFIDVSLGYIYDPCVRDEDCSQPATCKPNGCKGYNCLCPYNTVADPSLTRCDNASYIGGPCDGTTRCLSRMAVCNSSICVCHDFFRNTETRSCTFRDLRVVGENCSRYTQCADPYSICIEGVCRCAEGYRLKTMDELGADPLSGEQCVLTNSSLEYCGFEKLASPVVLQTSTYSFNNGETLATGDDSTSRDIIQTLLKLYSSSVIPIQATEISSTETPNLSSIEYTQELQATKSHNLFNSVFQTQMIAASTGVSDSEGIQATNSGDDVANPVFVFSTPAMPASTGASDSQEIQTTNSASGLYSPTDQTIEPAIVASNSNFIKNLRTSLSSWNALNPTEAFVAGSDSDLIVSPRSSLDPMNTGFSGYRESMNSLQASDYNGGTSEYTSIRDISANVDDIISSSFYSSSYTYDQTNGGGNGNSSTVITEEEIIIIIALLGVSVGILFIYSITMVMFKICRKSNRSNSVSPEPTSNQKTSSVPAVKRQLDKFEDRW